MVKELIGAKADVNVKDDYPGNTALLWAADKGYTEVAKELIDAKADVNVKDKKGNTALNLGHTEIANMIRARASMLKR